MLNFVFVSGDPDPLKLAADDRRFLALPIKKYDCLRPCTFADDSNEFKALLALHRLTSERLAKGQRGAPWQSDWIGAVCWSRKSGSFADKIVKPLVNVGLVEFNSPRCKITASGLAAVEAVIGNNPENESGWWGCL